MEIGSIYRHWVKEPLELTTYVIPRGYRYVTITEVNKYIVIGVESYQSVGFDLQTSIVCYINQQHWNSWEKM